MNWITDMWLRWCHPQAYRVMARQYREGYRRHLDLHTPVVDALPAAERFRAAMDAVTEQARRPTPVRTADPEDFNDLQAYLEGDARQQDAAALRLDQRALAAGQMTLDGFKRLHPDLVWPEAPRLRLDPEVAAAMAAPRFCHHPGAVTEHRPSRTAYRGRRESSGRRRLRRDRSVPWVMLRCPDCLAWVGQVEIPGLATDLRLSPCLLPTTGATPSGCNREP